MSGHGQLFTKVEINSSPEISADSRIFFMGSCFSQNIGNYMQHCGFNVHLNPFGIVFNPFSISHSLKRIAAKEHYTETELVFHNGYFHSLDHHGSFMHQDPAMLIRTINDRIHAANSFLRSADVAIITPGTAWSWYHSESMRTISNCHKLPQSAFQKLLLTDKEIYQSYESTVQQLRSLNPNIRIIFTISPVKHLRDGIQGNAVSKARLLSNLYQFLNSPGHENCAYFPAFEMVTEELRDYRFYAQDMAHPSNWTTEYIYNVFKDNWFMDDAKELAVLGEKFARMSQHRPMTEDNALLEAWKTKLRQQRQEILTQFPAAYFPEI